MLRCLLTVFFFDALQMVVPEINTLILLDREVMVPSLSLSISFISLLDVVRVANVNDMHVSTIVKFLFLSHLVVQANLETWGTWKTSSVWRLYNSPIDPLELT